MDKKYKKQKRNITVKISAVLLVVWLLVSVAFTAVTLYTEKEEQITKSHNDYSFLLESITSMSAPPYNEMFKYVDVVKSHQRDIVTNQLTPKTTCGADGTYDQNIQITMVAHPVKEIDGVGFVLLESDYVVLMDTDKDIYSNFILEDFDSTTPNDGLLNYDEFRSSFTDDQYDRIVSYLETKKDKDGYFYLLRYVQTYYNPKNGHIYPKTVEIVKAYEDSYGYGVAEVVETFELNPKGVGDLTLYSVSTNEPRIIDGQFVCNNYSSNGLIEDPQFSIDYESYDPFKGIVEKTGLFTIRHTEGGAMSADTVTFSGSEFAKAHEQAWANLIIEENNNGLQSPNIDFIEQRFYIRYVKEINLLECAQQTLLIGYSIIALFFLIIGVILTAMMCRVIKTQLVEEQKRIDVTNALAHDIKTPLFIISGYAQNLKENVNTDKRDHYADRIISRTQEVNELIHKMLEFTRLGDGERKLSKESINLCELLSAIADEFDTLPDKKRFVINADKNVTINGDKELLTRALRNLIDNAVRYSDSGSEITITLTNSELSVSNRCSTLSDSDIPHLTEPYYRVEKNRESKGNGLGLSIVKSILELHQYKLNIKLVDSIVTFTVSL